MRFELACSVPRPARSCASLYHPTSTSTSLPVSTSAPLSLSLPPNTYSPTPATPHQALLSLLFSLSTSSHTNRARRAARGNHRLPWRARDDTLVPWLLRRGWGGRDPGECVPGRVLAACGSRAGRRGCAIKQEQGDVCTVRQAARVPSSSLGAPRPAPPQPREAKKRW